MVIDFLGTGYGTLVVMLLGFALIAAAIYRGLREPRVLFPKELHAKYHRVEFDLNGVEDHVSFFFIVDNDTPYELVLTGENMGNLVYRPGGINYPFISPWQVQLMDGSISIKPHSAPILKITRILEFNLAAAFAYSDPSHVTDEDKSVKLNFAEMKIGIKSGQQQGDVQYGTICLQGDTDIETPIQHYYWKKYRRLYEMLKL